MDMVAMNSEVGGGKNMSLKAMAADKDMPWVKKDDLFKIDPRKLEIEPGWNLRMDNPEAVEEHIQEMLDYLKTGGTFPPIEVITKPGGRVIVRDGHCRREMYLRAIADGLEIPYVHCLPFRGNDAEQVVLALTRDRGLKLFPVETSIGYLRLSRFNWDIEMIAKRVQKTTKHVENMLKLATANTDVQDMVRAGTVSATTAIEAVIDHGEDAGKYLLESLKQAQAKGKTKVTKAILKGPNVPRKVWSGVVTSFEIFTSKLDNSTRVKLAEFETLSEEQLQEKTVEVSAAALLELLKAQPALDAHRAKVAEASAAGTQQTLEV